VKVVVLDSGPLWLLTETGANPVASACRQWARDLRAAGHRIVIPEIADYETRRELLRRGAVRRVAELDQLANLLTGLCEYLPLTTPAMRRAAELWATARQTGQPTAGDNSLDADIILIAQAESLADPNAIIATTNVGHLSRFFPADLWTNITP
jgi:predicted nucleic acid-binding protein